MRDVVCRAEDTFFRAFLLVKNARRVYCVCVNNNGGEFCRLVGTKCLNKNDVKKMARTNARPCGLLSHSETNQGEEEERARKVRTSISAVHYMRSGSRYWNA